MVSSFNHTPLNTGGLKTLSLFKFSYATNPSLQGKLLWTHLPQRDNLFAVFDYVTCRDPHGQPVRSSLFKVLRGTEVLEKLNLAELIHQSRLDEIGHHPQPLLDSSRVVIVIVKKPLIALRYQRSDGHIQRIQMNFSPETGYDIALELFIGLGLPIRDRSANMGDPSTQQDAAVVQHQQLQEVGIQQRHQLSTDHSSLSTELRSASQYSGPPTFAKNAQPMVLSGPEDYRMTQSIVPYGSARLFDTEQSRLDPSSTLESHLNPRKPVRFVPYLMPSPAFLPRVHTSDGRLESPSYTYQPTSNSEMIHPAHRTPPYYSNDPTCRTLFERESVDTRRPATAPTIAKEDSISDLLPPRRILPFPQLPAKKSELGVPPQVEMTSVTEEKVSKKKTAAKVTRVKSKLVGGITKSIPNSSNAKSTKGDLSKESTKPTIRKLDQLASTTLNILGNRTKIRKSSGNLDYNDTHPQQGAAKTRSKPSTDKGKIILQDESEITEEFAQTVDDFVRKHGSHPAPIEPPISDLAEYAAMPEEERLAALDAFILNLVSNDNFAVLCEDVEKSWRRIGLGF